MYIVHTSHHGFRQGQATYITILCRLHSLLLRLLRLLLERGNDLRGKSQKMIPRSLFKPGPPQTWPLGHHCTDAPSTAPCPT